MTSKALINVKNLSNDSFEPNTSTKSGCTSIILAEIGHHYFHAHGPWVDCSKTC